MLRSIGKHSGSLWSQSRRRRKRRRLRREVAGSGHWQNSTRNWRFSIWFPIYITQAIGSWSFATDDVCGGIAQTHSPLPQYWLPLLSIPLSTIPLCGRTDWCGPTELRELRIVCVGCRALSVRAHDGAVPALIECLSDGSGSNDETRIEHRPYPPAHFPISYFPFPIWTGGNVCGVQKWEAGMSEREMSTRGENISVRRDETRIEARTRCAGRCVTATVAAADDENDPSLASLNPPRNKSVFSLDCRHDTARVCCWAPCRGAGRPAFAAVHRYLLPGRRSAANPPYTAAAVEWWNRRTDGQMDPRPLRRSCYIYYASSAVPVM